MRVMRFLNNLLIPILIYVFPLLMQKAIKILLEILVAT
ncbi:putative membrane protein [Orientia chuto str. Dubai]|uniref:Putative membrane protein n=1 Tax=Orientia chuto str. Dubai TaxID=1359168 RepID=A0A0F3MNX1_9RICK|nr:putative membrane protein [Orientia chuto str. Dubai]